MAGGGWVRWLRSRRSSGGSDRLVPIGWAIGGMLVLALGIAAGITVAGFHFLRFRGFRPQPELTPGSVYDLLKVAFAVAAGVGGVVALVTAYRRQRVSEFAQDLAGRAELRESARVLNERFAAAAGQLGDVAPAVRLAGVYAMAGLADDWPEQRQTCVDVLCAYLRMPDPAPGDDAPAADLRDFAARREVRHTVIRVIAAHLQGDGKRSGSHRDWRGLDFDFRGAVFDGGSFAGAQFTGGTVSFAGARFAPGVVVFDGAEFSGGVVAFNGAEVSGFVVFAGAEFSGGSVDFTAVKFSGAYASASFHAAKFSGSRVGFGGAEFSDGSVGFPGAEFSDGSVDFRGARFIGGHVGFGGAKFIGSYVAFGDAAFIGSEVDFSGAKFISGTVEFGVGPWAVPPVGLDWSALPPSVTSGR